MGVEYDGSAFHGWQIQGGARTVQDCVQEALGRVADHAVTVYCAGRTDAGVHAIEQVVHFDSDAVRTERSWVLGANVNLPADVNVRWARPVADRFHARFSATGRHYRYDILNCRARSSLQRDRAVWVHRPLDDALMREAGLHLVGEHDFSSFRAIGCQAKSPVRTVYYLDVARTQDQISIRIGANAFLHHMVRNIAGVLIAIGQGDRPVAWVQELLELRDRTWGGVTAPPQGLYLVRVDYPERFGLGSMDSPWF